MFEETNMDFIFLSFFKWRFDKISSEKVVKLEN